MADLETSVQEVEQASKALENHQAEVDSLIEKLARLAEKDPEAAQVHATLEAKRADSRGWFQEYVLPAWNSLKDYLGIDSSMAGMPHRERLRRAELTLGALKAPAPNAEVIAQLKRMGYGVHTRSEMGFIPILVAGAAAVAAIAACWAYVEVANAAVEREKAILNSPELTPEVKAKLLQMEGGLSGIFGSAKALATTIGLFTIGGLITWKVVTRKRSGS
jgi:hypothetical protein